MQLEVPYALLAPFPRPAFFKDADIEQGRSHLGAALRVIHQALPTEAEYATTLVGQDEHHEAGEHTGSDFCQVPTRPEMFKAFLKQADEGTDREQDDQRTMNA
ncbi:hypothetical protein SDC9_211213 [bioreactor metagenome]|uniref:Uncharacterized protein n=1 Tax=bioreactor metagenome TaxID=1076179 RepID=A0A645JU68_9ZZZZ